MTTHSDDTRSTATKERALSLLGSGIPPSAVANALGVEPSYITQLMSDNGFADAVAEKKFVALSKHNERDGVIDSIEDGLLKKLQDNLVYMQRPMEILKSFQIINAAKRRGQSAPEALTTKQDAITLTIPNVVLNKVTVNIHNQVVKVGDKSLLTMPSKQVLEQFSVPQDVEIKDVTRRIS